LGSFVEFKVYILRMYSIRLSNLRSTSTLFPTQNISMICVQFETLAKNQNTEWTKCNLLQEPAHVKESSRYDLPLGSKKMAFESRRPQEKKTFPQLDGLQHLEMSNMKNILGQVQPIEECCLVDKCTSKDMYTSNKPSNAGPNLELVAYQLTQDLNNIFMQRQDWTIYHMEMVLQDNIRGVKMVGLDKYMLLINTMRVLAHIRFVYVRMSILSLTKEKEEGIIKVRWRVVGLGMGRMVLRYFPDRLWDKGNMERMSPAYIDGFSKFYVASDSKIYQHTVDRVMEDKEKEEGKTMVQKLLELKQKTAAQPAVLTSYAIFCLMLAMLY